MMEQYQKGARMKRDHTQTDDDSLTKRRCLREIKYTVVQPNQEEAATP